MSVVEQGTGRKAALQPAHEVLGEASLVRADSRRVPLCTLHVVRGDEGWLTAHAEADIARAQTSVDLCPNLEDPLPLIV